MRGWDAKSEALFSYVSCEARVPKDHPLRPIRRIVDEALAALSPEFEQLYAKFGRPSIPPERLLRALLLQAFYSVRDLNFSTKARMSPNGLPGLTSMRTWAGAWAMPIPNWNRPPETSCR